MSIADLSTLVREDTSEERTGVFVGMYHVRYDAARQL